MNLLCPFCKHEMSIESNASNPDKLWKCVPCNAFLFKAGVRPSPLRKDLMPVSEIKLPMVKR